MLKIDFGEEMVSVLNKDNMEIYPQPKTGATKPKPQHSQVKSPIPPSSNPDIQITSKPPVFSNSSQNSLKMTIKTGTASSNVSKSPHAPKSQIVPQKYTMPLKRKADTMNSSISPHYPASIKPNDSLPKLKRRASSSSISSTNSVVRDTNLYCYCRKPTSKDLIGCDYCPEWYHQACLGISDETVKAILSLPSWKCPECEKKEKKSLVLKESKSAEQGPMYLPIPNGAKFCEVKATRMDTWGTKDYEVKGFIPLDKITWVSINKSSETLSSNMEIPPLPDDLVDDDLNSNDIIGNEVELAKSKIVQTSTEVRSDRVRPSEVLNKKGVQALAKAPVEESSDVIRDLLADDEDENATDATSIPILPEQRTAGLNQINQTPPTPPASALASPRSGGQPPGPPPVVMKPAPTPNIPPVQPRPNGRPSRLIKETVQDPPVAVVEPTPVPKEPQSTASSAEEKPPVKTRQRPIQVKSEEKVQRLSTSEAAIERMKNEMRVAKELELIEEAERIREEAEKRTKVVKSVPNGSKTDTGPAARRGRRPKYRSTLQGHPELNANEAVPMAEVHKGVEAPEPEHVPTQPHPEPVQQLKAKIPRGRRSSPNVTTRKTASAVNEHVIKNIKKEKVDDQIVKNIKQEKVTDHSMEEILSRDESELISTKSKNDSESFNQSQCDNESSFEENVTNTSLETDDKGEEENADSSKNESYDELFFCYVCKSIYVSKKALAAHQKSAHSK